MSKIDSQPKVTASICGQPADKNDNSAAAMPSEFQRIYRNDIVDGLLVRDGIPNRASISASIDNYTILDGLREIPFSAFDPLGKLSYYSKSEERRTKQLADEIVVSGEINPLIVVIDKEGPYVLEGGHRFDALRELGKASFPALVVLDNDSLDELAALENDGDQIDTPSFQKWFDNSKVIDVAGNPLMLYHGTNRQFSEFDLSHCGDNFTAAKEAFFFTPTRWVAQQMADLATETTDDEVAGEPTVMCVYLSLQNPYVKDFRGRKVNIKSEIKKAKAGGHDGLILISAQDGLPACPETQYIAFHPSQIRIISHANSLQPPNTAAPAGQDANLAFLQAQQAMRAIEVMTKGKEQKVALC